MLLDIDRSINNLVDVTIALISNTVYTRLPIEQCLLELVRDITDIQDLHWLSNVVFLKENILREDALCWIRSDIRSFEMHVTLH